MATEGDVVNMESILKILCTLADDGELPAISLTTEMITRLYFYIEGLNMGKGYTLIEVNPSIDTANNFSYLIMNTVYPISPTETQNATSQQERKSVMTLFTTKFQLAATDLYTRYNEDLNKRLKKQQQASEVAGGLAKQTLEIIGENKGNSPPSIGGGIPSFFAYLQGNAF